MHNKNLFIIKNTFYFLITYYRDIEGVNVKIKDYMPIKALYIFNNLLIKKLDSLTFSLERFISTTSSFFMT